MGREEKARGGDVIVIDVAHLVMIELQRLFASLVLSTQKYVDPSHMLKKLKDKSGNTLKIGNQEDVVGMVRK
jgi:hypothetical protein